MTRRCRFRTPWVVAACLLAAVNCSTSVVYPAPITGQSETLVVRGEYSPLALARVDALSIASGQLVVRGGSATLTVPLPSTADPSNPTRHWALVTDHDTGRTREVTFTHDESLDDFTIALPQSEAEIRFGVFAGRTGGEVMVLAWGSESHSYYGWITIARRASSRP